MLTRQLSLWVNPLKRLFKDYGPLAAIALLVPGGSLVALGWLVRRRLVGARFPAPTSPIAAHKAGGRLGQPVCEQRSRAEVRL